MNAIPLGFTDIFFIIYNGSLKKNLPVRVSTCSLCVSFLFLFWIPFFFVPAAIPAWLGHHVFLFGFRASVERDCHREHHPPVLVRIHSLPGLHPEALHRRGLQPALRGRSVELRGLAEVWDPHRAARNADCQLGR